MKKVVKTATGGNKEDDILEHSNENASMIDETGSESEEEEEGGWSEMGPNGKRKAIPRDTNSKNKRNNNNNSNCNHNKDVEMNEQQGPVRILQTNNNH